MKTLEANTKKGSKDDNHDLVMGLFHKICRQLDALSHFHFTPKPVVSEVSVQGTDLPSLSMEEVAPSTHISAVSTMAPEEVMSSPTSDLRVTINLVFIRFTRNLKEDHRRYCLLRR